jgi:hypothetical protein
VFPLKYELGFYIPEDGILQTCLDRNAKSYFPVLHGDILPEFGTCTNT